MGAQGVTVARRRSILDTTYRLCLKGPLERWDDGTTGSEGSCVIVMIGDLFEFTHADGDGVSAKTQTSIGRSFPDLDQVQLSNGATMILSWTGWTTSCSLRTVSV